jgi:hypothetical protein
MAKESSQEARIDWQETLEEALTVKGSLGNAYNRFYVYSYLNCLRLRRQGVQGPVASYQGWQELGRHVVKGARGKEILRPITVKRLNEETGEKEPVQIYKLVRGAFDFPDTEGDELPPAEIPGWDFEQACRQLGVTVVTFMGPDSNTAGYSYGRNLAINPMALRPNKTRMHELAHITLDHTVEPLSSDYENHRGLYEFEAEGTAHLVMKELEQLDDDTASESRAYIQQWLGRERPPDSAIRHVFKATDSILRAGRLAVVKAEPVN